MLEVIVGVFGFILSCLGTILVMYFKDMKSDVADMSDSIQQLNIKMETVINDQGWHKEELTELKNRVKALEHKE